MSRAVGEWIGRDDDTPVPLRVRVRVFERYEGRCYLTGRKIRAGEKWQIEHRIALANGGENREGNLAPALVEPHAEKTKADVALKSKIARTRAKHLGLWKAKTRGFDQRLRKRMDGTVELRETTTKTERREV